jgi:hypothetical protein
MGLIGDDAAWDMNNPTTYWNVIDTPNFGNGRLMTGGTGDGGYYEFDRYAVVSYGPDGAEGELGRAGEQKVLSELNDDIVYMFHRIPNETAYRIF